MNKIIVNTKEQLDELYKDSAFTLEGMAVDDKNLNDILEWIKKYTSLKREDVYIIEGSFMNRIYHLTGVNAYPNENCNIVCVKLSDMDFFKAIVLPRFDVGGRWFDDIVDNNARREEEKEAE